MVEAISAAAAHRMASFQGKVNREPQSMGTDGPTCIFYAQCGIGTPVN